MGFKAIPTNSDSATFKDYACNLTIYSISKELYLFENFKNFPNLKINVIFEIFKKNKCKL